MAMDKDKLVAKQLESKMTKKQKISHIWYYHKIPIIVSIIALIFIGDFIIHKINQKDTILNVSIVSSYVNTEKLDKLIEKATDDLVADKKENELIISFTPDDGAATPSVMANQKIAVQIAAQELDILVLPKAGFDFYAANGTFLDLKEFAGLSEATTEQANYVMGKNNEDDTVEKPYGIDVSNLSIFKEIDFYGNEPVLAVLANGKNREMTVMFIDWLFEQSSK